MQNRILQLAIVAIIVNVFCSAVFALPLIGPPKSRLQEAESSFGFEFSHSEMDITSYGKTTDTLELISTSTTSFSRYEIEDLTTNMIYLNLAHGVRENVDVFARIGAADGEANFLQKDAGGATTNHYRDFDGGYGFSGGIGARATFFEDGDCTWGGLVQMTWYELGSGDVKLKGDSTFNGDAELSLWDAQVAIGPTLDMDNCCVYGGPFLSVIEGDLSLDGVKGTSPDLNRINTSHDIKEQTQFGVFAGAECYLAEDTTVLVEAQLTDDAWGVGIGINWRHR